jgi:hypothetical protein
VVRVGLPTRWIDDVPCALDALESVDDLQEVKDLIEALGPRR